ncbi:hypothetical protein IPA_04415 [Ignicoccus pacificus DSM 13166]|uniref:Citrate transporter-like domain-containing protein n=1 Tax=Ignicoccus pacificus DSM 13166 TaxID=940294 RepID=A0A977KB27_9CREN|nr:hypothetical protein IPA_04415 [Ignicoccus pacificus DSM 13166]
MGLNTKTSAGKVLLLAVIATFVLSFIVYANFKITEIQGPLAKVVEKIILGFQIKHCETFKFLHENQHELSALVSKSIVSNLTKAAELKCPADINSITTALAEAIATTAFVTAVLGTLLFWRKRLSYVMLGVAALLFFGVAPYELIIEHMELGLILFLISMMVIVEYLSENGVLEWITVRLIKLSKFRPIPFVIILAFLSWLMAALVDEVTSIVFVTKIVISIAGLLAVEPIPLIIYSVMATNIGSAATMIGNPIGIYIALQSGKSFEHFIEWATPGSLLALLALIPIGAIWLRKHGLFNALKKVSSIDTSKSLDEWNIFEGVDSSKVKAYIARKKPFFVSWLAGNIEDPRTPLTPEEEKLIASYLKKFTEGWIFFITVILLIAFHTLIASALNAFLDLLYSIGGVHSIHATITPDAVLIFTPIIIAAIVMLKHEEPRKLIEHGVEWWTLVFFMFLFAIASALSYTGVTDKLAFALVQSTGGLTLGATIILAIMIAIISAIISAFLDNMPVVVALSPVVKTLIEIGLPGGDMLWWALLYGATMGGNMTMIGSTANIVALGILEKEGYREVKFMEWFKIGIIVVTITLGLALAQLILHGLLVYS